MPEDLTLTITIDDQGTATLRNLSRESRTAAATINEYGVAVRRTSTAEEQGNRSKNEARTQARRLIREQRRITEFEGDRAKALARSTEAQIRAATGSRKLAERYREAAQEAQRAEQRFQSGGRAAQAAGRSYLQTGTNIGFVARHLIDGARLVVRFSGAFLEAGDTMLRVQGRLNLVTESSAQLEATQTALFRSAQRTGSEFQTTVTLYSRMAQATQDLEISQTSQLRVTEAINQAFQVSGATTEGAKNATIQLTQALAGGVVRAEEFNSIVENSPELVQALARGLDAAGGSVGKLRQLIVEGQVTSEDFFRAIEKEAPGIAERFAKIPETFARASQRSSNELTRFLANLDESTGISKIFGNALNVVSAEMAKYSDRVEQARNWQRDLNEAQEEGAQSAQEVAAANRAAAEAARERGVATLHTLGFLEEAEAIAEVGGLRRIQLFERLIETAGLTTAQTAALRAEFTNLGRVAREETEKQNEAQDQATAAVKAATTELEKETEALQKKLDTLTGATTSIDADTRATLEGTEAGQRLLKTYEAQTAANKALKEEIQTTTQAKKEEQQADRAALAEARRVQRSNERSAQSLEAGNKLLAEEIEIKREAIRTGEEAAETEDRLTISRLRAAAAVDGLTEAEEDGLRAREELQAQARETDEALDAARDGTDILAESQREAILTTGDLRDAFDEMITGLLRGTRSFKDIGDTIADFAIGAGANFFKNFLFGKQSQFDQPLIGNVQGLFGTGGIIPSIFQQGGANSFLSFGRGFSGQGSLFSGSSGLLNTPLGSTFGFGGQLPPGIAGPVQPTPGISGYFGELTPGGLALGAGAGLAGYGLGSGVAGQFGFEGGTGSKILGGIGGAAGFALGGPVGAFIGSFLGSLIGSLFGGQVTRISAEKKGIDKFYQEAVGVDLPRSEKKVGRYLGPAREGPLGSTENALTAAGVLYALEVDEGGLGTVARFRNQGLAGFQRAGLSEAQGQEKALGLAGALGGQSPEDLIAGLNRALSGDFDRDSFTRSEVLENVAENEGEGRDTRNRQVRLTNVLAGIIDLSTEFNEHIDSSALAAELTADEIEQALEKQGRSLEEHSDIIAKVREGGLHAAEALTEIGGLEFSDLTFSAEELKTALTNALSVAAIKEGTEALTELNDQTEKETEIRREGLEAGKSLVEIEREITRSRLEAEAATEGLTEAEKEAIDARLEEIDRTKELNFESQTQQIESFNNQLERENQIRREGLEAGKSQALIEEDIIRWRLESEFAADGLTESEKELIDARLEAIDHNKELIMVQEGAQRAAAQRRSSVSQYISDIDLLQRIGQHTPLENVEADRQEIFQYLNYRFPLAPGGGSRQGLDTVEAVDEHLQDITQAFIQVTLDEYQAKTDLIRQEYAEEAAAIKENFNLRRQAQRQEIQALQTQLRIAQDYNRAADSLARNIGQIVTGPQSTLSGTQQLAFFEREAGLIRAELETAQDAERPHLIAELGNVLTQITGLSTYDRADPRQRELVNAALIELEDLRAEAMTRGEAEDALVAEIRLQDQVLKDLSAIEVAALGRLEDQMERAIAEQSRQTESTLRWIFQDRAALEVRRAEIALAEADTPELREQRQRELDFAEERFRAYRHGYLDATDQLPTDRPAPSRPVARTEAQTLRVDENVNVRVQVDGTLTEDEKVRLGEELARIIEQRREKALQPGGRLRAQVQEIIRQTALVR